ncbi:hypothetical protein [Sandarakinorhabdus sp.]|uniref:hypothetical protein n=1 Tax=Sandarakinorhabdus sp. TaxID=1916663 RepID=UPI00286DD102|nr:hypothetical protein [Sandarakinorhabdus sp.]
MKPFRQAVAAEDGLGGVSPSAAPADAGGPALPVPAAKGADRLRWGLTGLAAIFLVVLLAAAWLRPVGPGNTGQPQGDSLANLGVAPGAAPSAPGPAAP